ncbi:glycoside hydrolase family 127 protein [Belliella sp. DSM 111904]|uniref:Glycoside hydrolase family 127 protein n=1 Tax=Belliella filtrata TaxID=2923435 RepID=A0ABS9UVS7_9BACT|nr:glycoside hydrolase family 127 protein [Belliella filtrata]MCH7408277.1 glycoside hydrolase family 127 protein [Belliella filtrata]
MTSSIKLVMFSLSLCVSTLAFAQKERLHYFPLDKVKLLDSPFKKAQEVNKKYILEMDVDRLLAPYMKDAGVTWEAENYGNWENTGLDGHIGGHYLSALAMLYASSGDVEIKERLDYMIAQLKLAQDKNGNGYLGGVPDGQKIWEEIRAGKIKAGGFSLNDRWVPLYNIHKIYAGLRDAYLIAGVDEAKDMLVDLTDWFAELTKDFSDEQFQEILISEHGGLNEVFADLAEITNDQRYLVLARKMSHREIMDPLAQGKDQLTGKHANTQIPKVIGFQRIAQLDESAEWNNAAEYFWENVTNQRSISIGGNSVREHFHGTDDFSPMLSSDQGPETCNTYNMMRLSEKLFESAPDRKYIDFYERAMYNHILSSQHPEHGGFVYFTPMRPNHYRVYSQPHENFWCCVGSGLENHTKYGQVIYANQENDLFVNLFIPSELNWSDKGVRLIQQTNFPYEESTTLTFDHKGKKDFNLKIRYPSWVERGSLKVKINGKEQPITLASDGYVLLNRKWKKGDQVQVLLPMKTKVEYLADGSPWGSFVHGPIVLAAETGTDELKGLIADDSRMGHVASGRMHPIYQTDILNKVELNEMPQKQADGFRFLLAENSFHNRKEALNLMPFYELHDSRYQVYWPILDVEEVESFRESLKSKDELMLRLERMTLDKVAAGEQQPESEHDFRDVSSKTGQIDGRFWRSTSTSFQYTLKNPANEGATLRVTYLPVQSGKPFHVLVNGEVIAKEQISSKDEALIIDKDYDISGLDQDTLEVKFESVDGEETAPVHFIRVLKSVGKIK